MSSVKLGSQKNIKANNNVKVAKNPKNLNYTYEIKWKEAEVAEEKKEHPPVPTTFVPKYKF